MFRNYLTIAWRNFRKQRGLSFINIFGLAVGLASCLLITLYVLDELSYDRYNAKANRIYRIHTDVKFGGNDNQSAVTADPIGPTLKQDYPQVEQFVRLHQRGTWLVKRAGSTNSLREDNITFADSTLFDVFTLPLISGNPKAALTSPNTIVISESAAKRHFGEQNPMGQTLTFNNDQNFKVTGVMRDMPINSHFRSDFFPAMLSDGYQWGQWLSSNHHTYIVLREGTNYRQFEKNLDAVVEKYVGPEALQFIGVTMAQFRQAGNRFRFSLMPLTDIHLYSKQAHELAPNSDVQYVYIFSIVALFILLIAGINFMNLATARSANRAKEVGVRKVLGSERQQLIGQFMTESVLMTVLAMILALIMVAVSIPFFNGLAAKQLSINSLFSPYWLPVLVLLPMAVGLLAGSYPAFFLSSFKPISVLKGRINVSFKGAGLRSGLVVFQFMMSVVLIVGTIIVYRQITYIQCKNLGFNRDQVITVNDVYAIGKQAETFKEEVLRLPGVVRGSISGYLPTPSNRNNTGFFPEGEIDQAKAVSMQYWGVDYDYIKTFGMQLVRGRDFSQSFGSDSSGIILNETAAKLWGDKNIIGKRITEFADPNAKNIKVYTVIGVVKNFHFESLRQNIGALAMVLNANSGAASFRLGGTPLNSTNLPALINQIETKWKQAAPGQPFSYAFLEDSFDAMYRAEQRIGTIALTFAVLAILIACLGLFGLAAFMAEQRTKEIGVRKVLGASVLSIASLLSRDFLKLVLIAIVIASPIAWWAMTQWLADFAYKINIEWWMFALAGTLAVGIAVLTVSFQSIKAALMNPVKSLRSE